MALPQALQYMGGLLRIRIRRFKVKSCMVRAGRGDAPETAGTMPALRSGATPGRRPSCAAELDLLRQCRNSLPRPPRISSLPDRVSASGRTFRRHIDWLFAAIPDRGLGRRPSVRKPSPRQENFFRRAASHRVRAPQFRSAGCRTYLRVRSAKRDDTAPPPRGFCLTLATGCLPRGRAGSGAESEELSNALLRALRRNDVHVEGKASAGRPRPRWFRHWRARPRRVA